MCPSFGYSSSLSTWFFNDVNLANLLSQLEKNLCSLSPIYNHIEANIIETPIKKSRKAATSWYLNKIRCMKKGWITKTLANIKDKGARMNEDSIIILNTFLVAFIWDINSSSNSTILVFSLSVVVFKLLVSLSSLTQDITTKCCVLRPLKTLD